MTMISRHSWRSLALVLVTLLVAVAAMVQRDATHTAAAGWKVSGDVRSLPQRPDIELSSLPSINMPTNSHGSLVTTTSEAVALAERQFNLSDDQIDNNLGVVRALLSIRRDATHADIPAWVVTANMDVMGQGPATDDLVYHKVCIVIDAATGSYSFAYTADPQVAG